MPTPPQTWRQPLAIVAAAAVLLGVLARFKGLGTAPFAVDEYYLARSIQNVLRTGIPAFNCGGLYMRGIVLQYAAAGGQLMGLSGELAPRLLSALSSLLAIPAAFIIGRRVHGRVVGLLAVTIIAISVWEIEMARFGRMYAPFQAVFLWYLVFFLRYTVDREARALWPMILLSILGPLVWEGGVFLPLVNLLSVYLQRWPERVPRSDWAYLVCCTGLLALAVWFVTANFRGLTGDSWPLGYDPSLSTAAPDAIATFSLPLTALLRHRWWLAGAVPALAAAGFALRWIWQLRARRFLAAGLVAVLIAAAAHQFLAAAAIGLLLLLTRLADWRELISRPSLPFRVAIALFALLWLSFGVTLVNWHAASADGLARSAAMFAYQFLRFPDVIGVVVRPWARAVPHLGTALLLLLALAAVQTIRSREASNYERTLLTVFLVLLLAASASHPPREETRYVFFLYPVAVIIGLAVIARAAASLTGHGAPAAGVACVIALGGFALSEDFQPRHLLHIDSPAETFRTGMTAGMQSHLVIREDYRQIARWLQQHRSDHDIVISGTHGLDRYYPKIDYFYVDERSSNFPDWSCRRGTIERWGNYPLLYSDATVTALAGANSAIYLVAFVYDREQLMHSFASLHPRIEASTGDILVLKLQG